MFKLPFQSIWERVFGSPQGSLAGEYSLNLDFAITKFLDPRVTFTRASSGTYFDAAGTLQSAANNVARFDHDPSSLVSKGLLIEESRTNLLLQSGDLTQAAWTKTDLTVTRDQVGIGGIANTACKVVVGSSLGELLQQAVTVSAGATLTYSVYAKFSVNPWIRVQLANSTGVDGCDAYFNLQTGAKGSVVARGAGTGLSSSITACAGGYYRLTVTCTPNGSYTSGRVIIVSALADNSITRAPGSTYILDAHQIEAGAFATSYIPTTTTALTRAADVASMTGTNFSSWYNASEGTFVVKVQCVNSFAGATRRYIEVSDNTANERFLFGVPSTTTVRFLVTDGGVTQADVNGTSLTPVTAQITTAAAYKLNSFNSASGGVIAGADDSSGTIPTVDRMFIGADNAATANTALNGHIARLTYYPTRLSNSTLQGLSL